MSLGFDLKVVWVIGGGGGGVGVGFIHIDWGALWVVADFIGVRRVNQWAFGCALVFIWVHWWGS